MKKISTFLLGMAFMLGVANAQDITVFDFDGVTPTFSNGGWGDTFVSDATPLSDAVNSSANVGKLTLLNAWSPGNSTAVDIDPRVYSSYEVSVYSPNSTTGKVQIQCKDAAGNELDWYEQAIATSTGWIKFTRNLMCTSKIAQVVVFFNHGSNPKSTSEDIVYLDNLVFKKSTNPFLTLYSETFFASWSQWGSWSGAPSTKAGSWFGRVDLQTTGDANLNLDQWWGDHGHILKITSTDAAVIIPDINVAGFDSLKLSYDTHDEAAKPIIDVKVGSGDWVSVATASQSWSWSWKNFVSLLEDANGNPISNVSTISLRFSNPAADGLFYDNVKILGKEHSNITTGLSNELKDVFSVYPNPATNYILTPNAQQVTITDLNGRVVKEAFNTEKVDVSSLVKGVYIVKAQIGTATKIGKLIKE